MAGQLNLHSSIQTKHTSVSNIFIDRYMPQANGSYVKVYLYLLRLLSDGSSEPSITGVADVLDETEKDVERALKYWEKQKLLRLERSADQSISGIEFFEPAHDTVIQEKPDSTPAQTKPSAPSSSVRPAASTPVQADKAASSANVSHRNFTERPNYSTAQIKELTSIDEIKWLIGRIEQITGSLVKPSDTQLVLYLYESVNFSAELIAYLYEYCVSKNKKNTSYIESVALAWADNGIDSVDKAKAEAALYNDCYNVVNRAFGLNRAPGNVEIQYLHRWSKTFGFDNSIIEEACNRTLLAVTKPDFKYTDRILTKWHDAGIHKREDIAALDAEFARQNAAKAAPGPNSSQTRVTGSNPNNRFNSFPQRKYSASDYSAMEKRLLNKTQ